MTKVSKKKSPSPMCPHRRGAQIITQESHVSNHPVILTVNEPEGKIIADAAIKLTSNGTAPNCLEQEICIKEKRAHDQWNEIARNEVPPSLSELIVVDPSSYEMPTRKGPINSTSKPILE